MTAPLPDARLAEIEAVEAAATKGPWLQTDGWTVEGPRADDGCGLMVSIDVGDPADGTFIAMAREAVPELVAEVRRLQAVIAGEPDATPRIVPAKSGAFRVRYRKNGSRAVSGLFATAELAEAWIAKHGLSSGGAE